RLLSSTEGGIANRDLVQGMTAYDLPASAILRDHELREIRGLLEEQSMQSEAQAHNVRAEARTMAEPRPQHADAAPRVPTGTSVPRRRLTTRELARRRRQRLLELLQQPTKPPASPYAVCVPAPALPKKKGRSPEPRPSRAMTCRACNTAEKW